MILSVQELAVLRALAEFAGGTQHDRASDCLMAIADALGVTVDFDRGVVSSKNLECTLKVGAYYSAHTAWCVLIAIHVDMHRASSYFAKIA
jgi:hypothetical protein